MDAKELDFRKEFWVRLDVPQIGKIYIYVKFALALVKKNGEQKQYPVQCSL